MKKKILITKNDLEKLQELIGHLENYEHCDHERKTLLLNLKFKLHCATIVNPQNIPPTYITMNSTFQYSNLDTNKISTYSLVLPEEANIDEKKMSVISPVGISVLGHSIGDIIKCELPIGITYLKILDVKYQPETLGIFTI